MFKKLLKIGSLTAAGYVAYKVVDKQINKGIEVLPIDSSEIILMLKEKGINILLGYDKKIVHFINEDKSIVIQGRINDENKVFLIEYLNKDEMDDMLVAVYPQNVISDDLATEKAILSFRRLLGSIGVSILRFEDLIVEISQDSKLADLSF